MEETWRPVYGFEDHYAVSDGGVIVRTRTQFNRAVWKVCSPSNFRGYRRLCLSDGVTRKNITVHKVVWESFNSPVPTGLQINHLNGVKSDNRLVNLEVCTAAENTHHSIAVLGAHLGSRNGASRLSEDDIRAIRMIYSAGKVSQQEIADRFDVTQITISRVIRRATWGHVA